MPFSAGTSEPQRFLRSAAALGTLLVFRAAFWLVGTRLTIFSAGFVAVGNQATFVLDPSFVAQELVSRTKITIRFRFINEKRFGGSRFGAVRPLQASFTRHATEKIHLSFRHLFDDCSRRVTRVSNGLLGLLLQPFDRSVPMPVATDPNRSPLASRSRRRLDHALRRWKAVRCS